MTNFVKFLFRKVMLRVDARQGAPKDGNSPLELFEVIISYMFLGSVKLENQAAKWTPFLIKLFFLLFHCWSHWLKLKPLVMLISSYI